MDAGHFTVIVKGTVRLDDSEEFDLLLDALRLEFVKVRKEALSQMTSAAPILVRWYWPKGHLASGQPAFFVEIPTERMAEVGEDRPEHEVSSYLGTVEELARIMLGSVTEGHVTCVMAATGAILGAYENPAMPYSGMWNAYNPLQPVHVQIADVSELAHVVTSMLGMTNARE